jgi:HK97 family phage major capsid protein/HK97 family phage prohead protease
MRQQAMPAKKTTIDLGDLINARGSDRFTRAIDKSAIRALDDEQRTVELAFSSEAPVRRYFGDEVLDHGADSVRMERLNNAAAVLVNHDHDDQVGVVESARIDSDGMGRAVVRFGNSARASEIYQDVKDGIRQLISFGYSIHQMRLESSSDDDADVYRATDWEPHEISIVSVPADPSVGVGRSDDPNTNDGGAAAATHIEKVDKTMPEPTKKEPAIEPGIDHEAERKIVRDAELERIAGLRSLGASTEEAAKAEEYIRDEKTVADFITYLESDDVRQKRVKKRDIGLTPQETQDFRMSRLLLAMAEPNNREFVNAAGLELEASAEAAKRQRAEGVPVKGAVVPGEIMRSDMGSMMRAAVRAGLITQKMVRALTAGTATDGAELVATDLRAIDFIDVLRNRLVVMNAGAVMLDGLVGDVAIPRKTSSITAGWISTEGGNASLTDPQFDQVTMTPKTLAGATEFSRQLLLQSSLAVEAMVRLDQVRTLAVEVDRAALYGSGASGEPTGVTNTSGINAPANFAAADPTFAEVVDMETQVAVDNADLGSLSYITDAAMRGAFKTTEKAANTAQFIWEPGGTVNGYPCWVTNQVTDGDLFFANWNDLLLGAWGGLDVLVDPYTNSLSGTIRVVSHQSLDVAVRHPVSFAFNNDGV